MSFLVQTQASVATPQRIYVTHGETTEADRQKIKARIAQLSERGGITERDERLLEYLRDLSVLSLNQIHRLLFPNAKEKTAYQRMYTLSTYKLIGSARIPRAGMTHWGLPLGKVYTLGVGGRLWLKDEVNNEGTGRYLKRDQVLHDLLVAEVCVRLIEAVWNRGELWSLAWVNERAASYYPNPQDSVPVVAPDGMAVVRQKRGHGKAASLPFFIELDASREAHGRPSSDWGRKVIGYDRYRGADEDGWKSIPALGSLPTFPIVAVITHGEQRLLNLAQAINEHRKQKVVYYLALWEDLLHGEDILSAPAWLVVSPDGEIVGVEPGQRQALLPAA